ncbi:MAG: RNB domain-containing ribonuclease, partial [Alphaproteobacteria bacterium]|nr:RNB domain-containing ribonuclease [Alphaproteobacteria bacterium]
VLRSQSQAYYSPNNLGHFGLNLNRYAHFTSPIRRYADLIVHRSLIRSLKLGDDGLAGDVGERLEEIGEHISITERRAMTAERDANDRYMAAYMSDRVGAEFDGRIVGVTRFGLFIEISENGAEGLIPMRSLKDDFYHHDEQQHALIGERTGVRMRLGDRVTVKLLEATPITGGMRFELVSNLDEQQVKKSERPTRGQNAGRGKSQTRSKTRRNKGKPKKKAKR